MKFINKIEPKNRIFALGGIVIVAFILVIAIASIFTNKNLTFANIESKMKNAAKSYFNNRQEKLPNMDGNKVTISIDELVDAGNIKPLNKLIKNATCTGSVTVMNNNGFYLYLPYLDCNDRYKTATLSSVIKENSKVVSSGNGLYKIGEEYVFRGEYVDNYVTFANEPWRIIKINADNTIRLMHIADDDEVLWDNRYNSETKDSSGINNYLVSRIRDKVVNRYNNNKFFNDTNRSYLISHDVCIGKRNTKDDNAIECSQILEKQPLSLPRASEIMIASIDPQCITISSMNCTNYNWMAKLDDFWTVTADSASTNYVYRVNGIASKTKADRYSNLNVVIHLSGDIIYTSGDGSSKNPYIIN